MLATAFYWILNMSIMGSITGLLILCLRQIKAIPRNIVSALWLIPLIRLFLPFSISSQYSLMALLSKLGARTIPLGGQTSGLPFTAMNSIRAAESYNPLIFGNKGLASVFFIGSVVWIIVFLALLFTMILLYSFTKTEIKGAVKISKNVYESDRITSPAVYGIIRPGILVPVGMPEQDLSYAVLHENAHISRGDNFFRFAALAAACFHWFNPLVWVFLKYCFADMELACDTKVMRKLNPEERRQYASSLLHCLVPSRQNLFIAAFGGAKIKVRVENILSYRKLTAAACISFFVLAAAIGAALLTNA